MVRPIRIHTIKPVINTFFHEFFMVILFDNTVFRQN